MYVLFTALAETDSVPSITLNDCGGPAGVAGHLAAQKQVRVNGSAQIRARISASGASDRLIVTTRGWIDTRGRSS